MTILSILLQVLEKKKLSLFTLYNEKFLYIYAYAIFLLDISWNLRDAQTI